MRLRREFYIALYRYRRAWWVSFGNRPRHTSQDDPPGTTATVWAIFYEGWPKICRSKYRRTVYGEQYIGKWVDA